LTDKETFRILNDVKKLFEAQAAMCRNEDQVLSRWKEHFEQHLNEGEERDQPPNQVDLGDTGYRWKLVDALERVIQLAWTS
jgi:hypothetical protein